MRYVWRTPALLVVSMAAFGADDPKAVLKAMHDELQHSQGLDSVHLEKPYFISYTVEDGDSFGAVASLGGMIGQTESRFRVPRVEVRVGSYQFDNTNYVGSGRFRQPVRYRSFPFGRLLQRAAPVSLAGDGSVI